MEIEVSTTEYSYSVKVINPLGKAGHVVHALQSHSVFIDVSKLKESILSSCKRASWGQFFSMRGGKGGKKGGKEERGRGEEEKRKGRREREEGGR